MKKIYSKVEPKLLLHVVNLQSTDTSSPRVNITPEDEYLQVAMLRIENNKTFRPHKHIECHRHTDITQESWVVVKGKVKAFLYDIDDTVIAEPILGPGDCSITFRGGHTYQSLSEDTLVYEYKTGPYLGIEKDKEMIDDTGKV